MVSLNALPKTAEGKIGTMKFGFAAIKRNRLTRDRVGWRSMREAFIFPRRDDYDELERV